MSKWGPVLVGLGVIVGGQCIGYAVGCREPQAPSTASLVERCKLEAKESFADGGTKEEAAGVYDRCIARAR